MHKRKAPTRLSKEGEEPNPEYKEPDIGEEATPYEIAKRKIYRAKRPLRQPDFDAAHSMKFQLNRTLVSAAAEEKLLEKSAGELLSFGKADELKEKKTVNGFGSSTPNALSSLIRDLNEKKDSEVVDSFIKTKGDEATPEKEYRTRVTENPESAIVGKGALIEAKLAVNGQNTREGFIEFSSIKANEQFISALIFRNAVKNIVYQATLPSDSTFTMCKDQLLSESDEPNTIELEITTFRKTPAVIRETCRIAVDSSSKELLFSALSALQKPN